MERFIITSALPYANGPIHIGHIAGAYLPADIFVRYQKLQQNDVIFICGSDEHGAAITLRAKKEQKTPKIKVSKTRIAIKNSLSLFLTLFIQEIIHIGVMNAVSTINKIEIPSTPSLNFINPLIQFFSSKN